MQEKDTNELSSTLGRTHLTDYPAFMASNQESMLSESTSFSAYIKNILKSNGLSLQAVFLRADIPERYGYKLLSGEKHTRQRDVILRICYAAELTLEQTQRALHKYELPELYAKIPRDALIMIAFNERPGSILDVNAYLKKNLLESLRTIGLQN